MPGSKHTKKGGDPIEKHKRKIADVLGTDFSSKLTANAKKATVEDLLRKHGFLPPGGTAVPSKLKGADLTSITDAIEEKTGWTYGGPPTACCSCWG